MQSAAYALPPTIKANGVVPKRLYAATRRHEVVVPELAFTVMVVDAVVTL